MSVEIYGKTETTPDPQYLPALNAANVGLQRALEVYSDPNFDSKGEGWKKKGSEKGLTVFSGKFPFGKVYAVRGEFNVSTSVIFEDHWKNLANTVNWNKNVTLSNVIATISDSADVIQYATDDVLVVKGKEFVVGRVWREVNGVLYVAASSFDAPQIPVTKGKSRAIGNVIAGRFQQVSPNQTIVDFIASVDFNDSKIPKNILGKATAAMVLGDAVAAKKYIEETLGKK